MLLSQHTMPKDCIIFTYPKMGKSGEFLPDDLKNIAGLTGCSSQCIGYEQNLERIKNLGYVLIAISSQSQDAVSQFKDSLQLHFQVLSDPNFELENEFSFKTFITLDDKKFYHRQTLIFQDQKLIKRFDFVSNPQDDAKNVIEFLQSIQ